ncbi:hypothetical protein I4U23_020621 [Adineta vaga]|nr:hypothetical protein I4U23_020621 [Adineta vaga]
MSGFINNRFESRLGMDLNGDGYIGGQGFMNRIERATHIDFNRDNIIGRQPDVYYGYGPSYGYTGYTGYGTQGYPTGTYRY